jgi:hypothetical protein
MIQASRCVAYDARISSISPVFARCPWPAVLVSQRVVYRRAAGLFPTLDVIIKQQAYAAAAACATLGGPTAVVVASRP